MNRFSRKYILLVLFLVLLLSISLFMKDTAYAIDFSEWNNKLKEPKGILFVSTGCTSCIDMMDILDKKGLEYYIYDITEDGNYDKMYLYMDKYNVAKKDRLITPILITNSGYYNMSNAEEVNVEELSLFKLIDKTEDITNEVEEDMLDKTTEDKILDEFSKINILLVALAGFLDGFNPCSISIMLFFISYIYTSKNNMKLVTLLGISFIVGHFIAYFLLGLGLVNFAGSVVKGKNIIYILTALLSLYISIKTLYEYVSMKKGKVKKNLFLDDKKSFLTNSIDKGQNALVLLLISFGLGFALSGIDFFCTGQMYLPMIGYTISIRKDMLRAISMLLVYNVFSISQLVIVLYIFTKIKSSLKVQLKISKHLGIIKLITSIFFFLIFVGMLSRLISPILH